MRSRGRPVSTEPKSKLLEAASRVFAAKGYESASVRDIVAEAGMSLNAINFHFGTKQQLYVEVVRYQTRLAEARHPAPNPDEMAARPKEGLRSTIEKLVAFMLDADSPLPDLYARELIDPSPAFRELTVGLKYQTALRKCIGELLGEGASASDINQCQRAIYAQCAHYMLSRKVLPLMDAQSTFSARTVGDITTQIVDFSLGGIARIKQQIRKANAD